jgi:hypothetical protein
MSKIKRCLIPLMLVVLLVGCGSSGKKRVPFDFGPFVESDPYSVLVAPIVAPLHATEKDWFLSTITKPLAERGYYVFPVRMSQQLAALAGFGRGRDGVGFEEFSPEAASELAAFFGADSVLFCRIMRWEVKDRSGLLSGDLDPLTTYTIGVEYHLTNNRGETIWNATQEIVYTRGGGNGFVQFWNFLTTPSSDVIQAQLAAQLNRAMIEAKKPEMGGRRYFAEPMLVGPYHERYSRDRLRRQGPVAGGR